MIGVDLAANEASPGRGVTQPKQGCCSHRPAIAVMTKNMGEARYRKLPHGKPRNAKEGATNPARNLCGKLFSPQSQEIERRLLDKICCQGT